MGSLGRAAAVRRSEGERKTKTVGGKVDPGLLKAFKLACVERDINQQAALEESLRLWLRHRPQSAERAG